MNTMGKICSAILLLCAIFAESSFAQEKNPTTWPYSGVPDSSRYKDWMGRVPLNFKDANFNGMRFRKDVDFKYSIFSGETTFGRTQFDSLADFQGTEFYDRVYFDNTSFEKVKFTNSKIKVQIRFWAAWFNSTATFINVDFDSISFTESVVLDSLVLGSVHNDQKVDLLETYFTNNSRIVLRKPVDLKIQSEKIKHIRLHEYTTWEEKKQIVYYLKANSFKDQKDALLELDYLFAKSTMFEDHTDQFYQLQWYHFWKRPKWIMNYFYYITMGLGYRPFRLIWWALGLILSFGVFYIFKMPDRINQYILKDEKKSKPDTTAPWFGRIVNCLYFSAMVFFTFRLKKDILTFFTNQEKRIIVGQWLIGFLIYVAFLTLSKSGSILQNLKDLFVG